MDLPKVFNKMPAQINFYSPIKEISLNSPQSVAIQAPDRAPLNYSNLVRQIQYCANSFKSMDLNHESRIGIVLPNGPEMASCCLGVMCSAVCAPLNPNYQADEFQFYLDDINADAIILPEGFETPAREVADKLGIKIKLARLPREIIRIDRNTVSTHPWPWIKGHKTKGLGRGRLDHFPKVDAHSLRQQGQLIN